MAKGIYVGGSFTTPGATTTIGIDVYNINQYFSVINGDYYFDFNSDYPNFFETNNQGVDNSVAETTLIALQDISEIGFWYSYSSEANYDKFTLIVAGETIEDGVSGYYTEKHYSGSLSAGDAISFKYTKDVSGAEDDDTCSFYGIKLNFVSDGTTTDNVARKVIQPYVGVDNIARKVLCGYMGVDNVARRVFGESLVTWNKYTCYQGKSGYEDMTDVSPNTGHSHVEGYIYRFGTSLSAYSDYTLEYDGYYGNFISMTITSTTSQSEVEDFITGAYELRDNGNWALVYRYDGVHSFSVDDNSIGIEFDLTEIASAYPENIYFNQGVFISSIAVPEGELPEDGTLVEGSADGTYCVLEVNGTHYYYTRT